MCTERNKCPLTRQRPSGRARRARPNLESNLQSSPLRDVQGLSGNTLRKSFKRTVTCPPTAGYARCSKGPYSAVEVPPKVFVVPGRLAPPKRQMQRLPSSSSPPSDLAVVKIG